LREKAKNRHRGAGAVAASPSTKPLISPRGPVPSPLFPSKKARHRAGSGSVRWMVTA
jgi:hypothetical protein